LSTGEKLKLNVSDLQKTITEKHIKDRRYILGTDLAGRDLLS